MNGFIVLLFLLLFSALVIKFTWLTINEADIVISDEKQKITKEGYLDNLVSEAENAWPSIWEKFGFKKHNGDFFKSPIKIILHRESYEIFLLKNDIKILVYVSCSQSSFYNEKPMIHTELWYDNLVDTLEKIISEFDIQIKERRKEEESKKIEMLESEDLFDGWD